MFSARSRALICSDSMAWRSSDSVISIDSLVLVACRLAKRMTDETRSGSRESSSVMTRIFLKMVKRGTWLSHAVNQSGRLA